MQSISIVFLGWWLDCEGKWNNPLRIEEISPSLLGSCRWVGKLIRSWRTCAKEDPHFSTYVMYSIVSNGNNLQNLQLSKWNKIIISDKINCNNNSNNTTNNDFKCFHMQSNFGWRDKSISSTPVFPKYYFYPPRKDAW